jgi:hypothetical protein
MKRIMTAALALVTAAGLAVAADVISDNVVGYQTLNITGGNYNMLAVQWDKVQGGNIDIQGVFQDVTGLTGSTSALNADQILVWDPVTSGYTTYWLYDSGGTYPSWDGKWIDGLGGIASAAFPKGTAFWLVSQVTDTNALVSAGQAPSAVSVNANITAGNYNMVANPYPASYALNSAYNWLTAGADGSTSALNADQILVWDPVTSGYTTYWLYDSGGTYPSWDGKWIDGLGGITADSLLMGQPAWFVSLGGSDWTLVFSKPY